MIQERLKALRQAMKEHEIAALIVPTSDFHDTEYVSDHFGARKYFSGFTGSAGVLVVLADQAGLWTDGRYFIQAARELEGSGIELMKMGLETTPSISTYILEALEPGQRVAFDGRCVSMADFERYEKDFAPKNLEIVTDLDLAGEAWPDRPALPSSRTFHYDESYTGESVAQKLARVREAMKKAGADHHISTKIDEIAWLYNLRADDIPYFPVALAYTILDQEGGTLYIDQTRLDDLSRSVLEEAGIAVRDYDEIYRDAKNLQGTVLMDPGFINSRLGRSVASASKSTPVWAENPVQPLKAVKNEVEVQGAREAHKKDAAAMIRFWKWLEEQMAAKEVVTEISAAEKLKELRAQQPDYLENSFATISAYGPNAAMAHYHPDPASPVILEPRGLYLVDSGGQYLQGTTDITRTFVLGPLTPEERRDFTLVLQGHIDLARAVFPKGARGMNLDILARQRLWQQGRDFNHGTGHGVGALSNVHEGPNGFRWRMVPERRDSGVLEAGMITSDEPGIYEEGKYGIRHENLLVTVPAFTTRYGEFLGHDVLTLVPFDLQGIDASLLSPEQKDWLNRYHQRVYETVSPLLDAQEAEWLEEKTRPI